ncbi:hypothetical protein ACOSQ3_003777 [Xanthoceras sorbifolium]
MEERVDEAERRQMQNEYEEPVMPPVMRDYALPVIETSPSCILLDEMSRNYELKNIHFNMLPYFHGAAGEDPLTFMREFYSIITTFPLQRLSEEQLRMRCFPYTMKDVAKQWLMTLPAASLCTWSAVYKKFMGKFYSHQKTAEIRNKIACFTQGDGESFHEAWDRYKLLLNHCPHHRYPLELQNQFFYDGLTLNCQATVDNAAGGAIAEKTMEETFQLFEKLGANSQQKSVRGRKPGVYELKTTPGMVQQMAELSRQVQSLMSSRGKRPDVACSICGVNGHEFDECSSRETCQEFEQEQVQALNDYPQRQRNDPYSNNYNPGWRNHPNFSWRDNQQQQGQYQANPLQRFQPFQQNQYQSNAQNSYNQRAGPSSQQVKPSIEDKFDKLMQMYQQQEASTRKLEI